MNTTKLVVAILTFLGIYFCQRVDAISKKSATGETVAALPRADKEDKVSDTETLDTSDDGTVKTNLTELDVRRRKRAIIGQCQFMTNYLRGTKYNCWDFNGYGNWCGRGGSGGCVNEIDDCCYTHDKCWDSVKNAHNHNCFYSMYIFYDYDNDPCSRARGNTAQIKCCRCDFEFAKCLGRYVRQGKYDFRYKGNRGSYNTGRRCYKKWN